MKGFRCSFVDLALMPVYAKDVMRYMGFGGLMDALALVEKCDPDFPGGLGGCCDADWSPTDPESLVGLIENYLWDETWSESLISQCREGVKILQREIELGIKHDPEDPFSDPEEGDFLDAIEELERIAGLLIETKNIDEVWEAVESYIAAQPYSTE